jgi:hypothetical protein
VIFLKNILRWYNKQSEVEARRKYLPFEMKKTDLLDSVWSLNPARTAIGSRWKEMNEVKS